MKSILVTGGAGFIGSDFIRYMLETYDCYRVINLDRLTYAGNLENLIEVETNKNYRFIKGTICDKELLEEIFRSEKVDYVINFAAESHVDRSLEKAEIFLATNILGTQNLLSTAKEHWRESNNRDGYPAYRDGVKYIQISTDEVYGTLGKYGKFTETSSIAPNNPYSATKASADLMVRAYYKTFKLPMNITRCSNNYGPYQFPEKLIPLMIVNSLRDKQLPIYGDGLQIRDWLYVRDHCTAIDAVLQKGKLGEVYNIGGNNEKTNLDIVRLILEKLGKDESLIKYVEDRLGHDRRYAINSGKITNQLGWVPSYTFEEGINKTIDWYVNNQDWISHVINKEYLNYYDRVYKMKVEKTNESTRHRC